MSKNELLEHGYKWQADRIDNWIHRLQKQELAKDVDRLQRYALTSKRETEEGSF